MRYAHQQIHWCKRLFTCSLVILFCFLAAAGFVKKNDAPANAPRAKTLPAPSSEAALIPEVNIAPLGTVYLPLFFEPNVGQADAAVKFLSRSRYNTLLLTEEGALLSLLQAKSKEQPPTAAGGGENPLQFRLLRMKFGGSANPRPQMQGTGKLESKSNYFIGNDPAKWHADIANYSKVQYDELYPGIALVFYSNNEARMEFDFIVAPGADYRQIRMAFDGADRIRLDEQGNLVLELGEDAVYQRRPRVHQEINGGAVEVPGEFVISPQNEVAFRIGEYDLSKTLVIDPSLAYSTYLGGTTADYASSHHQLAVDGGGCAYMVGSTSGSFPTVSAFQPTYGGSSDAFVAKLNSAGSQLVYSTYLGGSSLERWMSVAVDDAAAAYITGETWSANFPLAGAYQNTLKGGGDAFVSKLSASGSLLYSTYLGGGSGDAGNAIAIDSNKRVYVAGKTYKPASGPNFPGLVSGFNTFNGSGGAVADGFLARLDLSTNQLDYAMLLGSSETFPSNNTDEKLVGVAVDSNFNAYVVGVMNNPGFPTQNPYNANYAGTQPGTTQNAVLAEVNPAGTALVYSTYFGATNGATVWAVAVDNTSRAVIVGSTSSTVAQGFPIKNALKSNLNAGDGDGFIARFIPAGNDIDFSTYFGGDNGGDGIYDVGLDNAGNIYVTGSTGSDSFPVMNAIQSTRKGNIDAFISKITASGTLEFSTYIGGTGYDYGYAIAIGPGRSIYAAGETSANDFPTTSGAYQTTRPGGASDCYIVKFGDKYIFLR